MKRINLITRCSLFAAFLALCTFIVGPVTTVFAAGEDPMPTTAATGTEKAFEDALESLNKSYSDDPFGKVGESLSKTVAGVYRMMRTIGFMALILCALVAALCFRVFQNEEFVLENKTRFVRILETVALIALIMTVIGLVASTNTTL